MRGCAVWTLAAALALAAGAAAQEPGAGDAPAEAPKGNWFTRLFSSGKKAEAPKPPPRVEAPSREAVRPPTGLDTAAAVYAREKALLDQREAVCDKLRDIAQHTGDTALERMADQLNQRAWTLYQMHTGSPGLPNDEQILAGRLGGPAAPGQVPAGLATRTPDTSSRTAARREQP
jgi:hypothetical protein